MERIYKKWRIIAAKVLLVPFLGLVIAGFLPMWHEVAAFYIERGRREMGYTQSYDYRMMKTMVGSVLEPEGDFWTDWGATVNKTDPQRADGYYDVERTITKLQLSCKKVGLESLNSEWGIWVPEDTEKWQQELGTTLTNFYQVCERKFGSAAMNKARIESEKKFGSEKTFIEKRYLTPSLSAVFLWFIIGILLSMLTMGVYALIKARLYGFKAWIEIVSGRAFAAGITWVVVIWKIYPGQDPRKQLQTAIKFATGWLTAVLWLAPGAMGQKKGQDDGKVVDPYAYIDKSQAKDKPAALPKGWSGSMDLRNTSMQNGDQAQAVRVTFVRKSDGFLIETITTEKETAVGHTGTVESYPGFRLLKKSGFVVNAIAGGKFISATNSKAGTTVHNFRALFGGQVFGNWGRWKLESPVNRFEIPVQSPKDRKTFAHVSQLLFRLNSRWQIGEEVNLIKPWGLSWQKTLGFMARLKLSVKTGLEFGYFRQPDFVNPNKEDHAFRTRALLAW